MSKIGSLSGGLIAEGVVKEMSMSAIITRADGRTEDLGVISEYKNARYFNTHKNPLRRLLWYVTPSSLRR